MNAFLLVLCLGVAIVLLRLYALRKRTKKTVPDAPETAPTTETPKVEVKKSAHADGHASHGGHSAGFWDVLNSFFLFCMKAETIFLIGFVVVIMAVIVVKTQQHIPYVPATIQIDGTPSKYSYEPSRVVTAKVPSEDGEYLEVDIPAGATICADPSVDWEYRDMDGVWGTSLKGNMARAHSRHGAVNARYALVPTGKPCPAG